MAQNEYDLEECKYLREALAEERKFADKLLEKWWQLHDAAVWAQNQPNPENWENLNQAYQISKDTFLDSKINFLTRKRK